MENDDDKDVVLGDDAVDPRDLRVAVAVLQAKVKLMSYIIRHDLVTRYEFVPVKLIAYGIAGVVISSVLVAILSYVVRKP